MHTAPFDSSNLMEKTVIFLDFDGVICDSLNECLVSSWIAYYRYYKKNEPAYIDMNLRKSFLRYRPFITHGEDYVLIQKLINEKIIIRNNEEFDLERKKIGIEIMALFKDLFYRARDYLISEDFNYWLNLNRIFPFLYKPFYRASRKSNIHILSTKREKYIRATLEYHGIRMNPEQIHYSSGKEKLKIISRFLDNDSYSRAIFIDDQIDNLKDNRDGRIEPLLALWGFIDRSWLSEYPSVGRLDEKGLIELLEIA